MPQILRPKKPTDGSSNIIEEPKTANVPNVASANIREVISSVNTETKNVVSSVTPPSNLSASSIANRTIPPTEVHDQPTQPEISDALQKLLDMKVSKTLASAKASLEEGSNVLNKTNEAIPPKPILGKEIRVPKPAEVVQVPVVNNQTANTTPVSASPITSTTTVTPVASVVPTTNVAQPNNSQPIAPTVQVTQEVPKKSFLDKLLGF